MRDELTERYRAVLQRVSAILFSADPIGLADMGAPTDEYEPEARLILARSGAADSPVELGQITYEVFVEMFDAAIAGAKSKYEFIATELWPVVEDFRKR